jgi:hypothetical protein
MACGADQQDPCPTSQSTTFESNAASFANDGSYDLGFIHTDGASGVCGSGIDSMTPWWMVDFGYTSSIGGGKIWGRSDCAFACTSRLNGFQIWVGDSGSTFDADGNTNCYNASTTEHTQDPYTHAFDCIAQGRFLFVVLTTGHCLAMREIEIYSVGQSHSFFVAYYEDELSVTYESLPCFIIY